MKNKYLATIALTVVTAAAAQGATFLEDFSGLIAGTPGDPLNAYNGWTQSESNPTGPGGGPLAFGFTANSSTVAAIGVSEAVPTGNSFTVSHSLNTPLAGSTLSTTFIIIDSDLTFPDRNDYSIGIFAGLTNLFSLELEAADQNPPTGSGAQWYISVPGASPELFTVGFENGIYNLTVDFVQNLANVDYTVNLVNANNTTPFSTSGTIFGGAAFTIDSFQVGTSVGSGTDWGSGFIAIDNVAVVPEASSFVLLGMAALGMASRRRRN